MRIVVRRSGGFAGTAETLYDVDTNNFDATSAAELVNLVRSLGAVALNANSEPYSVGADFIKYEVTLSDDQHQRTVIIADDNSARLDPLPDC